VNACHSSSLGGKDGPIYAGHESGFMIAGEGHTIYVTGDTTVMADMGWMGEYFAPDIGILCAGGHPLPLPHLPAAGTKRGRPEGRPSRSAGDRARGAGPDHLLRRRKAPHSSQ